MKDTKAKNVPRLRFPEFTDAWRQRKLSDLASYSESRIYLKELNEDTYLGVENLLPDLGGKRIAKVMPRTGSVTGYSPGDILHSNIRPYLKKALFAEATGGASADVLVIRPKQGVAPRFLFYTVTSDKYFDYVVSGSKGVKMPRGDKRHIMDYKIHLPELSEQQKIADFLTAIDERMKKSEKKLELLCQYKKLVMQKIFSRQAYFKDENGNISLEWNQKKLGEIGKTYMGLVGKTAADFGTGSNFVTYMQIYKSSLIDTSEFGRVEVPSGEKQNKVKKGDVFFTISSETPAEVGIASVLLEDVGDTYLNSFSFGYRADDRLLLPEFARYLFHSRDVRRLITRLAQGSTRFNLSKNELMKREVLLPEIEEQRKIVDFLGAIDSKIKLEEEALMKVIAFKRSLLQRMFI